MFANFRSEPSITPNKISLTCFDLNWFIEFECLFICTFRMRSNRLGWILVNIKKHSSEIPWYEGGYYAVKGLKPATDPYTVFEIDFFSVSLARIFLVSSLLRSHFPCCINYKNGLICQGIWRIVFQTHKANWQTWAIIGSCQIHFFRRDYIFSIAYFLLELSYRSYIMRPDTAILLNRGYAQLNFPQLLV